MLITCPVCHAAASADVWLGRDDDARAVAALLERHTTLGSHLIRYISLFRPETRRLSIQRSVRLILELMPDIERGAIARKGRDWPAPHDLWRTSIEKLLQMRDQHKLTLPLTTHGLLYEVMCSQADKAEGQAEAQAEAERRQRRGTPAAQGQRPRDLGAVVQNLGLEGGAMTAPAHAPAPAPADAAEGGGTYRKSRAAREFEARLEAVRRQRAGQPANGDQAADQPE